MRAVSLVRVAHFTRPWLTLLVVLALAAGLVPTAAAELHPDARDGWLVGLGVGGGSSGISNGGNREGGGAASVQVGYAFTPQLSLELDGTIWTKEENGVTISFTSGGPTLNYYPGEGGLVLRGGVGFGSGEVSAQSGNTTLTATENGLGILGGIGYEFRVTRRFALGPQVHAAWIHLDSFNANWVTFELGCHWYFLKQ